jgi:hypothetical protein
MKNRKSPKEAKSAYNDECTIPSPVPNSFVDQIVFNQPVHQADEIREYVYCRTEGENVTHLEKLATEHIFDRQIEGWDVRTDKGRYWLVTSPMNLYSQELFPSLDYTITFHVGLSLRMTAIEARRSTAEQRDRVGAAWRKWEQAADALGLANEAEDFQVVGMRCRESLIAMVRGIADSSMVPEGQEIPKASDFIHWSELIAGTIAGGASAEQVRSHLKTVAKSTWQLVNWLTHASNVAQFDGRIALDATDSVLAAFSMALVRYEKGLPDRCPKCSSYRMASIYRPELQPDQEYFSLCESCGWTDLPANKGAKRKRGKKQSARNV